MRFLYIFLQNNFKDPIEEINLFYSNTLINKPNPTDKKLSVNAPNIKNIIFYGV